MTLNSTKTKSHHSDEQGRKEFRNHF